MSQNQDQDLIKRIAKGDKKAFEELLIKYEDLVFGVTMKLVKDRTKAEDFTQETWMKVIKSSARYSPYGSVKSWILQINRNLIMDHFRDQKKWKDTEDIEDVQISDDHLDASEMMSTEEDQRNFQKLFATLDERDKVVLTMVLVEELSYAEIAQKINLSVGAIKTIVFRAKKMLKEKLTGKEET
jgi:RNA polymerase sigma factor (sigma-70 family)